ncbi:MAG: 30S ribosomal protein S7 [Minisyncoccia bacterium]|jgi:small subunit ribosomal protein S7
MRRATKRRQPLEPDRKYNSILVAGFINKIMQNGKKNIAEKIVYGALENAEKKIGKPAMEVLDLVIENAGPQLELKSRRIGGANYQVPYEIKGNRRMTLAFRWIIEAARNGKGKPMEQKLTEELINAFNNTGVAVKKKQDTHRMADANKAFAHFAW